MQADRLELPRQAIRVETAAADAGRWAGLPEIGDWRSVGAGRPCDGRSRAGGWNERVRWFGQARPVRSCSGGRCPTFRTQKRSKAQTARGVEVTEEGAQKA